MDPGATGHLHVWEGRNLLGARGHREGVLGQRMQMVRHAGRHHLAGVGQEGLRGGLGSRGHLRVALRPRHGALHHLRVLLARVALRTLVALRHLGLGLMLMGDVSRIHLLVLGGQVAVREALLGQRRGLRAGNGPRTRRVPLRQRELLLRLLLLLRLGYGGLGRDVNGDSGLRHVVGIGPHLRRHHVARRGCGWSGMLRSGSVAGYGSLDGVDGGGRGPDRTGGRGSRLGGGGRRVRVRLETGHGCLGWHLGQGTSG